MPLSLTDTTSSQRSAAAAAVLLSLIVGGDCDPLSTAGNTMGGLGAGACT